MQPGIGAIANAGRPARSIFVEEAEGAMRSGVIEFFVDLDGGFELSFHFADEFERAYGLGAGELAEVHRQIIMGGSDAVFMVEGTVAGRDGFFGQGGAFGTTFGEI